MNKILSKKIESFIIQKRRLLVVWLYSLKQVKNLKQFGMIFYVSKKMNYALIYVNEEEIEKTEKRINKLHFVRYTQMSYRPDIEMNFRS
jgi:uncharacterized protein YlbG (UPF0298 family)